MSSELPKSVSALFDGNLPGNQQKEILDSFKKIVDRFNKGRKDKQEQMTLNSVLQTHVRLHAHC